MSGGKCSKYYPKTFVDNSTFDDDGYPVYRHRNDGKTVRRKGVELIWIIGTVYRTIATYC